MKNNKNLWVLGHQISPQKVTGEYDMVIGETPPNVPGPPPHFHTKFNELFLVLEGEMEFLIDGQIERISQNESIDIPPNVLHTFKNAGITTCKWANIHSPKGFLSFFEEMGIPASESDAIKKSVNETVIQKVMKEAANYDMHIKHLKQEN
jgi:mannose-6-phosphate isomerase-like protein (cupin superfamily)